MGVARGVAAAVAGELAGAVEAVEGAADAALECVEGEVQAAAEAVEAAAEEAGLSSNEIIVLRSLQARREALDERELGITTREGATAAAEGRLQEQIVELKAVEARIQGLLSQMETKGNERMASLVKTYEAMKPKDAAEIFDGMDDAVLLDIAKAMKPATLAAIMSTMNPKRAEALTRMLADLSKPPVEAALAAKPPA